VAVRFVYDPPGTEAAKGSVVGGVRPVLAVSHPGHELLVHGWLTRLAPRVFVLTDGSGRSSTPRLDLTTALLARAGITTGGLYGRHTDAEVYEWILDGRVERFVALAGELAKAFSSEGIDLVVGDAAEGFNPIHDAFRLTLNCAVALARKEGKRAIANLDFPLFGRPGPGGGEGLEIELDESERAAKRLEAASYSALEREVEWSLEQYGRHAFDREWLRPVLHAPGEYPLAEAPPIYERYGEHLLRTGELTRVIRGDRHVVPIARALGEAAGETSFEA
jgi:hypothetical protein